MGYPVIEFLPSTARDCSVEFMPLGILNPSDDSWENKSQADSVRVGNTEGAESWQVNPIASPTMSHCLVWDQRIDDAGSWVKFENVQGVDSAGAGLTVPAHGAATYFVHAWMMSTGPTLGADFLRVYIETYTGPAHTKTVRVDQYDALAQTWYELHATLTVPAGVDNVRAVLAIHRTTAASCRAIVRAGRVIDFPDGVKYDIRRHSVAEQARSHGGIVQTDFFTDHEIVSVDSHDLDRATFRNVRDFYDHAKVGGSFGFAADRADRSLNWSRALIMPPGAEPIIRPVGPERYRFKLSGAAGHEGPF